MSDPIAPLVRWRLVLGEAADGALGGGCLDGDAQAMDAALGWLYDRDSELVGRDIASRQGGREASQLSVPDWIDHIHRLFPQETIERLEQDAVERFGVDEIVTRPDVLERIEPNESLLRAVLRTKHLMNPEVLAMARKLVAEVVRRLMESLAREVRQSFAGTRDRRRRSLYKIARNLAFRETLRENLHRWDPKKKRLYLEKPIFHARTRRHTERWQVILVVDQSGSMVSSVIHSAVTAACLWGLPGIKTHLVAFDTAVVDLTQDVTDPVELLMKVQLGGGTFIDQAMAYAAQLVEAPRRAIVVLITDFYEGGSPERLVREVASLTAQGTKVLGLAALDESAAPAYDRELAARLVKVGAHVGAMTPGELAGWIAEKVRG
ncbi:MAG: VWA domain-containing protein [Myxococcales bacterium]|nr:VWA domain-containing protein [Myxococcales bacterium]